MGPRWWPKARRRSSQPWGRLPGPGIHRKHQGPRGTACLAPGPTLHLPPSASGLLHRCPWVLGATLAWGGAVLWTSPCWWVCSIFQRRLKTNITVSWGHWPVSLISPALSPPGKGYKSPSREGQLSHN